MIELRFYISEYTDGTLNIECMHMHYAFNDGFNYDDIPRAELFDYMLIIKNNCAAAGIIPKFMFK